MYIVYQNTFACLEFLKGKNYNYMCIIELVNQIWSKYSNLLHQAVKVTIMEKKEYQLRNKS